LEADAVVLAFGDSITHGTGARSGEDYPTALAALTGWRIINAGIPGDTSRAATGRIAPTLGKHRPDLMILELGGNDFLRQRQASAVKTDLRRIIRTAQQAGTEVILMAVPRLSLARAQLGVLEDSPIYAELAEEEGVPLFADSLSDILSDDALRADHIHPNAEGYQQLAAALQQFLLQQGFLAQ
jgi:acyl-CoA hydrolase